MERITAKEFRKELAKRVFRPHGFKGSGVRYFRRTHDIVHVILADIAPMARSLNLDVCISADSVPYDGPWGPWAFEVRQGLNRYSGDVKKYNEVTEESSAFPLEERVAFIESCIGEAEAKLFERIRSVGDIVQNWGEFTSIGGGISLGDRLRAAGLVK